MQFAALFVVIGALVSDNRDGKFIWLSLGIMAVSLIGRIITTYFSTMEQTETGYCMVAEKRIHYRRSAALHPDGLLQQE